MAYLIEKLDKSVWQGHILDFSYSSNSYYDLQISNNNCGFNVVLEKKLFHETFHKKDMQMDSLFQIHWENPEAYGVFSGKELVGVIELNGEAWSKRLRVTELWVKADFRRQNIATALMDMAKEKAAKEKYRALILETQSCNESAIAFYLSQSFFLAGFDSCCYSNSDIENKEVRLEFACFIG